MNSLRQVPTALQGKKSYAGCWLDDRPCFFNFLYADARADVVSTGAAAPV
jgi:hypothetical protein